MKFKGVGIEVCYKSSIEKGRSFILKKRDRRNRKSFRVFLNNEIRTDAGIMDLENGGWTLKKTGIWDSDKILYKEW